MSEQTQDYPPIRVLDMDNAFMFGLVRDGTEVERAESMAHGRSADLPISLLGLDNDGCACVDGEDVANRLADCWNACAGLADPSTEIAALREAVNASQAGVMTAEIFLEKNKEIASLNRQLEAWETSAKLRDDGQCPNAREVIGDQAAQIERLTEQRNALLTALERCDNAFASWQCGQIPGRPEDILNLINKVRYTIALCQGMPWFPAVSSEETICGKDQP